MAIDIQSVIDGLVSDVYPTYTILLGIGAYIPTSLITEAEFTDLVIEQKINSIYTATLTFIDLLETALQDQGIRIYLDGVKVFTGTITKCTTPYRSHNVQVECIGIVTKLQDYSITEVTDLAEVKTSVIITTYLKPSNWTYVIDTSENDFSMKYRLETGNYLRHINNLCIKNFWEWWPEEVDSDTTIATRKLMIGPRKGSSTPITTFKLESSAYDAIIEKDKEKLKNTVLVSGSSSQTSNSGTTAAAFFPLGTNGDTPEMGYVIGSESSLAQPAAVGDTVLYLDSVSGYLSGAYSVQIDDETIPYSAVDETTKTLTLSSAVTSAHEVGVDVLQISLLRAYLPSSMMSAGSVWIGNEKISYTSVDYWGIHGLTRGVDDSPAYAHGDGTKILSGTYSLDSPSTTSSLGKYGQGDTRISDYGSTTRDGLDKHGMSVVLASQKYEPYGNFSVSLDELHGLVLGDSFYLEDYDTGATILRRCMGLKFAGGVVMISFGLNEEYILNQFDAVNRIDNATYVKQDLDEAQETLAVSPDGTAIKILTKDGDEKWVTVR